jgi:hypothetical protein
LVGYSFKGKRTVDQKAGNYFDLNDSPKDLILNWIVLENGGLN